MVRMMIGNIFFNCLIIISRLIFRFTYRSITTWHIRNNVIYMLKFYNVRNKKLTDLFNTINNRFLFLKNNLNSTYNK